VSFLFTHRTLSWLFFYSLSHTATMARKKAQKKQETNLVPHRTPNLSALLERAKSGESADAVRAYLDAGGSPAALGEWRRGQHALQLPLLHCMAFLNAQPHEELAESVRLLVAAGADINAKIADPAGDKRTALLCAAERTCCNAVVDVLLQAGADASVSSSPKQMTALHVAAVVGPAGCCESLLARAHTLIERRDADGVTALMRACHSGRLDIAQLLLQHGADVNAVDRLGMSVLMATVVSNDVALVQMLLSCGADITATDNQGQHALFKASYCGHVSVMDLLVQCGLSMHAVDYTGITPLMLAAMQGQKPAAEWLLQHGVAVDAVANDGTTALHRASATKSGDDAAMVELLLASGADVHKCGNDGMTALEVAAYAGHVQCAKALIAAGVDVSHGNSEGLTALHAAIIGQHATVMQLLLGNGATAVISNVIHRACSNGAQCCTSATALMMSQEVDTVKQLLAAGADVHVTSGAGETCLHVAAKHNWKAPMLCLLIKAGADLHAVNKHGKTAAQLAHNKDHTLIEQLLNRAAQQGH
jgi:uncharacterized protein